MFSWVFLCSTSAFIHCFLMFSTFASIHSFSLFSILVPSHSSPSFCQFCCFSVLFSLFSISSSILCSSFSFLFCFCSLLFLCLLSKVPLPVLSEISYSFIPWSCIFHLSTSSRPSSFRLCVHSWFFLIFHRSFHPVLFVDFPTLILCSYIPSQFFLVSL